MSLIWILVSLLLSVVVIILHVIALSCLSKVKLVNFFVSQKYLIVSLCVTELYFAISTFLDCIGQLFGFAYKFQKYLNTLQGTHLYFMYLCIMVILTLDRFLEFRFNLTYFLIWSSKKTLIILGLQSCISLILFACLLPISDKMYSYRKYLISYIYVSIVCAYLLLASLTYYNIFKKIKENRKRSEELKKYFKKDQFNQRRKHIQVFLPSFIILTFILFNILPISLILLHDFVFPNAKWLFSLLVVIAEFGWIADPLIYIFTLKSVRRKIQASFVTVRKDVVPIDRVITQSVIKDLG